MTYSFDLYQARFALYAARVAQYGTYFDRGAHQDPLTGASVGGNTTSTEDDHTSTMILQHVPAEALPASPLEGAKLKLAEAMVRTTLRGEMLLHVGRVPTDEELDRAIAAIDRDVYTAIVRRFMAY